VVDDLPLDPRTPRPFRTTLTLLVGRVTTIKLAYWAAITVIEIALPLVDGRTFTERFPLSVAIAVVASLLAILWARIAARAPDKRVGILERSIPTVATTFAATTVVASPASLPLLIVERERSLEACAIGTCHGEALVLWIAVLAVGTVVIPASFAASLRKLDDARSLGH